MKIHSSRSITRTTAPSSTAGGGTGTGGDARGRPPGHTMDRLGLHGVEVLTIPYDKVISGGGGLHCSTAPPIRDEV